MDFGILTDTVVMTYVLNIIIKRWYTVKCNTQGISIYGKTQVK